MAIIFLSIIAGLGRPSRFCRSAAELALDAAVLAQLPAVGGDDNGDDHNNQ